MEVIRKTGLSLVVVFLVTLVVVGFLGLKVLQLRDKQLRNEAIQTCAAVAVSAQGSGGFNGAVYKICVEDKGYGTDIK